MKKRIFAALLCVVMILTVIPTTVFAEGTPDYRTAYIAVTKDIDLNNIDWTPIGHTYSNFASGQYFNGHFNGNGHTISNMSIEINTVQRYTFWGLFGICNGAYIDQVNVTGAITNLPSVTSLFANMVGGIVAWGCAAVTNCTSDADITITTSLLNTSYVAGIFGYPQQCPILNCVNTGDIICSGGGNPSVGGIGGCLNGIAIDSCENDGNICVKSGRAAGIVAEVYTNVNLTLNVSSSISNYYNKGSISTDTAATSSFYVGGIVGELTANTESITITNCLSTGSVVDTTGINTTIGEIYGPVGESASAKLSVSNCYYLNEIDNAENIGSTKISTADLTSVDFMNTLSGSDEKWARNDLGQIVLANQLADYTAVDAAIARIPADLSSYTDETVNALNTAQTAAIRNKMKSDQSVVDDYATAIENAITALTYKDADYSKVNAAIAKIPADLSVYTDETVKALNDAKSAVVTGKNISEQATVDSYAQAIEKAITDLKKKAVALDNSDSAKTGDTSNMLLWTLLLIISVSTLITLEISKKRKNRIHAD